MSLLETDIQPRAFWDRVRGFFQGQLGPDPVADEVEKGPLVQLLEPLDLLRHQALAQPAPTKDEEKPDQSDDELELLRAKQLAMRAEILELHHRLKTGLEESDLVAMSDTLKAHCKAFRAPRPDELSELSMLAVMARFHAEALEWAWSDFQRRLSAAGVAWPEPTGLTPRADGEQIARHRQLHLKELHDGFSQGPFRRFSDLVLGVVPNWRNTYPDPQGAVWRETVFEAVAAALACRRLSVLEALAAREHEALEKLVAEALVSELAPLQQRLSKGVSSVAEAREISDRAVRVCQRIAPEAVWGYLQSHLAPLG